MNNQKIVIVSASLALLIGAGLYWVIPAKKIEQTTTVDTRDIEQRAGSPDSFAPAKPPSVQLELSERTAKLTWRDTEAIRRRLKLAVATKDAKNWEPAFGELLNPNYRKDEAIAVLREYLGDSNREVRIRAAQELYELGSSEGLPTLKLALNPNSMDGDLSAMYVLIAARTLQRAGESIEPEGLSAAYQKYQSVELLKIAAQEGQLWSADVIRQKRVANEMIVPTELLAAYLGMNDAESIQRYNVLLTINAESKVLGHWALYRATGDTAHLQYVIDVVRKLSGLSSADVDVSGEAGSMAIPLLSITPDPMVTRNLEEIMDYKAGNEVGRGMNFGGALAALYFVQKDYGFVDQKVRAYFNGNYPVAGGDDELLWQIAEARRTPEIEQLAFVKNPGEYDLRFIRLHGRPIKGPVRLKR